MTFVLVFVTTLAVTLWVILRVFRGKPAPGGSTPVGGTISGGFKNFFKPIMEKGWIRPALMLGTVAVLFLFWDSISSGIASLFVQSDANESIGLKQSSVQRWLWIPGTILGSWLLLRVFKPKKADTCSPSSGNIVSSFFEGLTVLFIALVVGTVIIFVGLLVLDIAGVPKSITESFQDAGRPVACTTQKELGGYDIDQGGKDIVFCAGRGSLNAYPTYGKQLTVELSPKFVQEKGALLAGKTVDDFVTVLPPMTYPGSNTQSWKIMQKPGWNGRELGEIILTVRTI